MRRVRDACWWFLSVAAVLHVLILLVRVGVTGDLSWLDGINIFDLTFFSRELVSTPVTLLVSFVVYAGAWIIIYWRLKKINE